MEESQNTAETTDSPQTVATDPVPDEPKRKRGKRKVLKKTTKRDEKGYLGMILFEYC
jgi:DNA polymerase subunit Cdc27